jgi:hypothetical protein
MARPNDIPERRDNILINFGRILISSTKRIAVRINGNIMESRTTLLVNHVDGITANSREENNATVVLNLLSDILYIRKVSTNAIAPIINRGTANSDSIEDVSDNGFRSVGKSKILNMPAKKIGPKNG